MPTLISLPDNRLLEIDPNETILEALLKGDIAQISVCGGKANCSTCRIMVLDGIKSCSPPTSLEKALAKKLDFPFHVRLACQTKLSDSATIRRLVLDAGDIDLIDHQLTAGAVNTERNVALLMANIRGATNFDEVNFPYDIVYVMGRYFSEMQKIIEKYGGTISNVMGRKMLVVFGLKEFDISATERATWAALEMFQSVQKLNTLLTQMRYLPLTLSMGIHSGSVVFVPLVAAQSSLLTPLGEVAATVNLLESANKLQGTQLLVSEDVYQLIKNRANIGNKVILKDKKSPLQAYEILAMEGNPPIIQDVESVAPRQRLLTFVKKFAGSWLKSS